MIISPIEPTKPAPEGFGIVYLVSFPDILTVLILLVYWKKET